MRGALTVAFRRRSNRTRCDSTFKSQPSESHSPPRASETFSVSQNNSNASNLLGSFEYFASYASYPSSISLKSPSLQAFYVRTAVDFAVCVSASERCTFVVFMIRGVGTWKFRTFVLDSSCPRGSMIADTPVAQILGNFWMICLLIVLIAT